MMKKRTAITSFLPMVQEMPRDSLKIQHFQQDSNQPVKMQKPKTAGYPAQKSEVSELINSTRLIHITVLMELRLQGNFSNTTLQESRFMVKQKKGIKVFC